MPTKTLYDLLSVRPDDDAQTLQSAFRKAARANHPDLNPGDPDAAGRFRQIFTAYAILRDAEQRDAYDRLLAHERAERRAMLTRILSHAIASGTVTFGVLLCGYALFAHVKTSVETAKVVQVAARKPANMKVAQAIPAGTAFWDQRSEGLFEVPKMVTAPSAVASSVNGPPTIADGRPTEIHVVAPASPADTSDKGEPSSKSARVGFADVPIVPNAVTQETKSNEPLIIAKSDESDLLDQNRRRSVESHLLSSEKNTRIAKPQSYGLAIPDEKQYMRTTGKLSAHATRPVPGRASVRGAALESRDMSQVALVSRTTSACADSCSKRPPLVFGLGF